MTYVIEDSDDKRQDSSTITITVKCLRAPPVAEPDYRKTDENTPVTLDPTENDSDPEGEPVSIVDIGTPRVGSVTRNGNEVTYTPDSYECDRICRSDDTDGYTVTITYVIEDSDDKLRDDSVIKIRVNCVRQPPIARDDSDQTDEESPTTTPVLTNDEDPDDPANRISINEITEQPTYGTATQKQGGIEYNPTRGPEKCRKIAGTEYADSFIDTYKYNIIDTYLYTMHGCYTYMHTCIYINQ